MTKIYDFKNNIESNELREVASCIRDGGLVVFPTETVYGIGANAINKDAVNKIFKAKGRPSDNPLIVHVSDKKMLNDVAKDINKIEEKLINSFMPGPITIILNKKKNIPDNVTCGLNTVGIRMPENKIAREVIKTCGVPIAAPSANISGKPSGTNIEDIKDELSNKVDIIIDGGNCDIGLESTVVKVKENKVIILRPGKVTPEDIRKIGLEVKLDTHIFSDVKNEEKVESPGMKHRHYAPKAKSVLVDFNNDDMVSKIINILKENMKKYNSIAIIGFEEHRKYFEKMENIKYLEFGRIGDLDQISRNIFKMLRKLDRDKVEFCIIEGVEKKGLGIAIMNRLLRACSYNEIK